MSKEEPKWLDELTSESRQLTEEIVSMLNNPALPDHYEVIKKKLARLEELDTILSTSPISRIAVDDPDDNRF